MKKKSLFDFKMTDSIWWIKMLNFIVFTHISWFLRSHTGHIVFEVANTESAVKISKFKIRSNMADQNKK